MATYIGGRQRHSPQANLDAPSSQGAIVSSLPLVSTTMKYNRDQANIAPAAKLISTFRSYCQVFTHHYSAVVDGFLQGGHDRGSTFLSLRRFIRQTDSNCMLA